MESIFINEDLAPRYLKLLTADAYIFSENFYDLSKSPTLFERYRFRFSVYERQAQTFEKLFTQSYAAPVLNSGRYSDFRKQLQKHIILINDIVKHKTFTKNESEAVRQSAFRLVDLRDAVIGKKDDYMKP